MQQVEATTGPDMMREVFHTIYRENRWHGRESVSGHGSDLEKTAALRRHLPILLRSLGIRSMLDAPCGDFHWMSHVELGPLAYIGIDIVPDLIARNAQAHGNELRTFLLGDVTRDALPKCELILCRDLLVHLPFVDILSTLKNFQETGAEFILTTTYPGVGENEDTVIGGWRPLNLKTHPFNFGEPDWIVDEQVDLSLDEVPGDKCLALWNIQTVDLEMVRATIFSREFGIYCPPWKRRIEQTIDQINTLTSNESVLVLVDDELLPIQCIRGRHVSRFFFHDGQDWGKPADGESAIQELERLRQEGAEVMAIAFSSFWWLDYYTEFARYLHAHFPCLVENERVLVFNLRDREL